MTLTIFPLRLLTRLPTPVVCLLLPLLVLLASPGYALDDEWYFGFGGGTTFFDTQPLDNSINVDEDADMPASGSIFLGRDMGEFSSIQLQLNSFGASELDNGISVDYHSIEGAVLYRFYDSRDRQLTRDGMGLALYGRVGLGRMNRDVGEELDLEIDGDYYFAGGLGAEWFIYGPLSMRAEVNYVDQDVQTAFLGLAFRFGGSVSRTGASPPPADSGFTTPAAEPTSTDTPGTDTPSASPEPDAEPDAEPETIEPQAEQNAPVVESSGGDSDGDGVADSEDQCSASRPGFPVRSDGCALLNGVLSAVRFDDRGTTLTPDSYAQLDYLAGLLNEYPEARVQLVTHTDSRGSRVEQAKITRERLRAVGSYLVQKGISARRMVLRSLGGERPIQSNDTAAGRAANNRLEVFEQP